MLNIQTYTEPEERPNPMIVLSWDAVGSEDMEFLLTQPNFKELFGRGAACTQVETVFPSLTYPAHVTIMTGKLPAHHGVVNNHRVQPFRKNPDWFWQRRYIDGEVLFEEAEEAGLKTAALLWPVTGGAKISYNLPEVWANRSWDHQVLTSLRNGTPLFEIELYKKYGHLLSGARQPMLDHFVQSSCLYTLKKYRPDLLLVHLTDVDGMRHQYGVHSSQAKEALMRLDVRLGELVKLLKEQGLFQNTNLVVLGDHYQKDVTEVLYPNFDLEKKGWLTVKGDRIVSWKVVAQDCDGCCCIYLKNPWDKAFRREVAEWLKEYKNRPDSGIKRVYTAKTAREMGADPDCAFMLEAEDGFYFQNGIHVDRKRSTPENGLHFGAHGYSPKDRSYNTFFVAAGPDFEPGVRVPQMYLMDEGPILAKALGLELERVDGAVIDDFFRRYHNL